MSDTKTRELRDNEVWGLIKGRHDIPVDKFIFDGDIEDPTDVGNLDQIVWSKLNNYRMNGHLTVYVTGLTVCTVAVVKWAAHWQVDLTLMHYDRDTGTYFPQECRTNSWFDQLVEQDIV